MDQEPIRAGFGRDLLDGGPDPNRELMVGSVLFPRSDQLFA
jgi:hypothetical protein